MPETFFVVAVLVAVSIYAMQAIRRSRRTAFIKTYRLPPGLLEKLAERRPGLGWKERQLTTDALRQFFLAYLNSGYRPVSMPSQATDDLWHEFILYTRQYHDFCQQAFGRFLHHTPAAVMGRNRESNTGLRRVWWHTCREERIDPRKPARLPLLFALDARLGIEGGYRYSLDCHAHPGARREAGSAGGCGGGQCASDFSDSSFDGSTDGFGDGGGDGGGDGCGGGCGGD